MFHIWCDDFWHKMYRNQFDLLGTASIQNYIVIWNFCQTNLQIALTPTIVDQLMSTKSWIQFTFSNWRSSNQIGLIIDFGTFWLTQSGQSLDIALRRFLSGLFRCQTIRLNQSHIWLTCKLWCDINQ